MDTEFYPFSPLWRGRIQEPGVDKFGIWWACFIHPGHPEMENMTIGQAVDCSLLSFICPKPPVVSLPKILLCIKVNDIQNDFQVATMNTLIKL